MNLDIIEKHVHITELPTGYEVMFGGQRCLTVMEAGDGYIWKINELFAKMTYGANLFEDVPYCMEIVTNLEEAIATGLTVLNDLGAFYGIVDLPEDTYATEELSESTVAYPKIGARVQITKHHNKLDIIPGDVYRVTGADDSGITVHHGLGTKYNNVKIPHNSYTLLKESEELLKHDGVNEAAYATPPNQELVKKYPVGSKIKVKGKLTGVAPLGKNKAYYPGQYQTDIFQPHSTSPKMSFDNAVGEVVGHHGDHVVLKSNIKEFGTDKHKHFLAKAEHIKSVVNESVDFDAWVKESVMADCRKEAAKHCDSLMETHDLAVGLYESFMEELDEGAWIVKAKQLVKKLTAPVKDPILDQMKEISDKVNKRKIDVLNKKYAPKIVDEAALSGDAYWKAKEDKAKEAKAKEERAKMGIKEPVKKGRGKPTLIDREDLHTRAKENVTAGKRPTAGFDRNEKIHFVRHLKNHPDFAEHHVAAAGRPTGTTKAAGEEKQKEKKQTASAFSMWAGLGKK